MLRCWERKGRFSLRVYTQISQPLLVEGHLSITIWAVYIGLDLGWGDWRRGVELGRERVDLGRVRGERVNMIKINMIKYDQNTQNSQGTNKKYILQKKSRWS